MVFSIYKSLVYEINKTVVWCRTNEEDKMRETIYTQNMKIGNLEVGEMIILNWTIKKRGMRMWTRFDCLRRGSNNGYVVILPAFHAVLSFVSVFRGGIYLTLSCAVRVQSISMHGTCDYVHRYITVSQLKMGNLLSLPHPSTCNIKHDAKEMSVC